MVLDRTGRVAHREPWRPNTLAREGEQNILDTWLREHSPAGKYLCLLTEAADDQTTMDSMRELAGAGYARQPVPASDWSEPVVAGDNYQCQARAKIFGPAAAPWTVAAVALVSTAVGYAGKFLLSVTLAEPVHVAAGQSYYYTLRVKAV
jgi:hypothetical protein